MRTTIYSSVPHKLLTALVIISMVMVALPVTKAHAASTITVTTTTDEFTGVGTLCSLREAIALANSNAASANDCTRSGVDADDIIILASGQTYTLTIAGAGGTSVGDLDIGDSGGASGNLTIQTSDVAPATIDGNDIDRVFDVDAAGNPGLSLNNIIVTNGNTTGLLTATTGGGISFSGTGTLSLTNVTISDNVSASATGCGGGIYNNSAATVVISNSTISGNSCPTAGSDGAGIFKGGGGSLTITGSTISGNTVAENGGGIHLGGSSISATTVNITNSTFANNTAGTRGGGLQVGVSTSVVTVDFSTFSGNIANGVIVSPALDGGGALQVTAGSVTVTRSILADSLVTLGQVGTPADCDQITGGGSPPTVSITDSIVETNNDCVGTFTSVDPQLGALANYGGPTETMSIPVSSPAVDAADSCGSVTTDQRGFTRPQLSACDLGAFEFSNAPTAPTVVSVVRADPNPTSAASVRFTVTFSESVTGVDAADFKLTTTGVTGSSVSGVSGSGSTYTVTVNTGNGDGEIRLDVLNNNSIRDADDNPLAGGFTSGLVYTILKSAALVDVNIAKITHGNDIQIPLHGGDRKNFGVDDGPAQVVSTNGLDIVAALRIIWREPGFRSSYSELMGLPVEQLSDEYWFPWYNNALPTAMDQGFRIANVSETNTTVKVVIAGTEVDSINLSAGASVRVNYAIDNGPVQIFSTDGTKILAALRILWKAGGTRYSYAEMMGLPVEQLSDEYWFPWYNNALSATTMEQGFRIANLDNSTHNIDVVIGGTTVDSISLDGGASTRVNYAVDNGPVQIVCTDCGASDKIITALRIIWKDGGFRSSYSEMMGLPVEQLSDEYWFPWYNNALSATTMEQGFRIANLDNSTHNIDVVIGGTTVDSISLTAGASTRVNYAVDNGPVQIVCTDCGASDKIIAALRVIWKDGGFRSSYSEMMGLPVEALSEEYWFPWYNNAVPTAMEQGFRISVP